MKNNHFLRMILVSVAALLLTACEGELSQSEQKEVMEKFLLKSYELQYLCPVAELCRTRLSDDSNNTGNNSDALDFALSRVAPNEELKSDGDLESDLNEIYLKVGEKIIACIDCSWDVRMVGDVFLFTFRDVDLGEHAHNEDDNEKVKHNVQLFFTPTGQKCKNAPCVKNYEEHQYEGNVNFHFRIYHQSGAHYHPMGEDEKDNELELTRHDTTHGGGTDT